MFSKLTFLKFSTKLPLNDFKRFKMSFQWEKVNKTTEIHILTCSGSVAKPKIAAFDMDGTLITTKSGRVFPLNPQDWRLLFEPQVKQKLQKLFHDENYKIVIITNQAGMGTGKLKEEDFRQKVENVVQALGVPVQLFAATAKHCVFRKPRPGFWEYLEKYKNDGIQIDMKSSFYCGDAAGRIRSGAGKKPGKKDFSCSDRLFAKNVGIKFYVPEEIFLNQKCNEEVKLPDFDPTSLLKNPPNLLEPKSSNLTKNQQEIILMVGVQGSGKSFFAQKYLKTSGYEVISNDITGSRDKSLNLLKKVLNSGKSAVIDNTHVNAEAREKFIKMAKSSGIPSRCFVMNTCPAQARHNITFREIIDKEHAHIGEPIINGYLKNYQKPTLDEGFEEIVQVNVVPDFKYEQHKALYFMHLVEK